MIHPRELCIEPNYMNYEIRDYRPEDAEAVNSVAIAAFEEYRAEFSDWSSFSHGIGNMASLSALNEIVVAYANGANGTARVS